MQISLEELVSVGAHFGHQSRRWNPKMAKFLYGVKDGVHVFDLTKTKTQLEEALDFLTKASKEGKTILFVGTKKQAQEKIREVAKATGSFFIAERWLGGTFTNFEQIKKSSKKLIDFKTKMAKGEYASHTKRERVLIDKEISRLEKILGGLVGIEQMPDVVFVVDTKKESGAISESRATGRTLIGVVDSNSNPDDVDYAIPMNDDATRAVEFVLEVAKKAILEGKAPAAAPKAEKKAKPAKKEKLDPKAHDDAADE
jgi:small subunit ribosomal protein S2